MRARRHDVLLLLLFAWLVFIGLMIHGGVLVGASLWVKSAATSVAFAAALTCAIELADRFIFGGDQ